MKDSRKANANWTTTPLPSGYFACETAQLAVLMDLRDELQKLNRLLYCRNFQNIPSVLQGIKRNTSKKRKSKKGAR